MTTPAEINRNAFYDSESIRRTLGVRPNVVNSARRTGALRSVKRGGKVLIRGDWLETWLVGAEHPQKELAGAQ